MQLARVNKLWMIRSSLLNLDLVLRKIGRNVATNQSFSVSVIASYVSPPGAYVSMYCNSNCRIDQTYESCNLFVPCILSSSNFCVVSIRQTKEIKCHEIKKTALYLISCRDGRRGTYVLYLQLSDKSKRRIHVKADGTCNGSIEQNFMEQESAFF